MFVNVYDSIIVDSVFIAIANIKIIHFFLKKLSPRKAADMHFLHRSLAFIA